MANVQLDKSDVDKKLEHELFMAEAIAEARIGLVEGGIPIGSVLVRDGQVISRGRNRRLQRNSVVLHAEMDCIESAGPKTPAFYKECTIYTTLSPCVMCSGAIRRCGIPRVVIGDNKSEVGDQSLLLPYNVQVDVLNSIECEELLGKYIRENPMWNVVIEK